jgi:hypothetical protein
MYAYPRTPVHHSRSLNSRYFEFELFYNIPPCIPAHSIGLSACELRAKSEVGREPNPDGVSMMQSIHSKSEDLLLLLTL